MEHAFHQHMLSQKHFAIVQGSIAAAGQSWPTAAARVYQQQGDKYPPHPEKSSSSQKSSMGGDVAHASPTVLPHGDLGRFGL